MHSLKLVVHHQSIDGVPLNDTQRHILRNFYEDAAEEFTTYGFLIELVSNSARHLREEAMKAPSVAQRLKDTQLANTLGKAMEAAILHAAEKDGVRSSISKALGQGIALS